MKRAPFMFAALLAAVFVVAGVALGSQWLLGYRFMEELDRYYASYESEGGPWPQTQDACTSCHGANGQPRDGQYAALAGQDAAYIQAQLRAFANGGRHSPQMGPLAASLSETQIQALAEYFARQRPAITEAPDEDDALAQRGQATVAARGCAACHGADLSGGALGPRIAGQGKGYLLDQLKAFRRGQRQAPAQAMNAVAGLLTDDELEASAHYLAGLPPAAR